MILEDFKNLQESIVEIITDLREQDRCSSLTGEEITARSSEEKLF